MTKAISTGQPHRAGHTRINFLVAAVILAMALHFDSPPMECSPRWFHSISTNGAQPFASLTRGPDGKFYGTTIKGGAYDLGTVYSLSIPEPPSSPPIVDCPDSVTVECGRPATVNVLVSDPDGEALK